MFLSRPSKKKLNTIAAFFALALLASACEVGHPRGPDPTQASTEAVTGPFAITTSTVGSGFGFGGGTVYYPTDTSQDYGVVAIAPGWTASQNTISWYGPRLASQGFVVITIDVNSPFFDFPASRGEQLLDALDYAANSSPAADIADHNRRAVMGISMGGGGTLEASVMDPGLSAAIGLVPWSTDKSYPEVQTPTLLIGCENDGTAPVNSHALPFYNSITQAPKSFIEITGGSHSCTSTSNSDAADRAVIAGEAISWLKRHVDNDARYEPFVCPSPAVGGSVSAAQSNC